MIFGAVDDFLLHRCEQGCHWIQKWTGKTNFWFYGKASLLIPYSVLIGIMAYFAKNHAWWISFLAAFWRPSVLGWSMAAIMIPSGLIDAAWRWKSLESESMSRLRRGLANPSKISTFERFVRLMWIVLVLLGPDLFSIGALLCAWLRACDPLPPCDSKVKEFLRELSTPTPELARERSQ